MRMVPTGKKLIARFALTSVALTLMAAMPAAQASEPAAAADTSEAAPSMRRLSGEQYVNIISAVFGPTVKVGGRFEPDIRENGLFAVGASKVSVSATGIEQYHAMARTVAAQVVDERRRATLIPCRPASEKAADEACARQFLANTGRILYRRPLTQAELNARVAAAGEAANKLKNFYTGLQASLTGMLVSPQFLFRQMTLEPDPARPGQMRMDGYTKAAQLSFFLWDSAPDIELLNAAEKGELHTRKGLEKQVERLLASRKLEAGVRALFTDMLRFDEFETLAKDTAIYPKFTTQAVADAREQTLRTIVDHLLVRHGDYRDLYTTRRTFLTPTLGTIYAVPVEDDPLSANGGADAWTPYEFPANDPRGVGILSQIGFLALYSHPGRSSPTLRGKALREVVLCQKVPDPPGNVNFTLVQNTGDQVHKTARERLGAHATEPMCSGCHKLTDPMGYALESFDSDGAFRSNENGAKIDTSGVLDGAAFADAPGLGRAVHDNPLTASCLVNRVYSYGTGRPVARSEREITQALVKDFAKDDYRLPDLLRRVAASDALYRVAP